MPTLGTGYRRPYGLSRIGRIILMEKPSFLVMVLSLTIMSQRVNAFDGRSQSRPMRAIANRVLTSNWSSAITRPGGKQIQLAFERWRDGPHL